jgi:hypothetical protein
MRRFFSLLMMLVTLNVSAAEALRVCAGQEKHAAPREHCDEPAPVKAPPTCCDAMTSCTFTLIVDGATDEERVVPDADAVISPALFAPATQPRSPEPPPPKGMA